MLYTGALMSRTQLVEVSQMVVAPVAGYKRLALYELIVDGRILEIIG